MTTDPTGYAGPHPDLRMVYYEALVRIREQIEGSGREAYEARAFQNYSMEIPVDLKPEDLTITCWRTWRNVRSHSPQFNGRDFSTGAVLFESGGLRFSFFAEAWRVPDTDEWLCSSMNGAGWPLDEPHDAREMKFSGGRYVCVGGQANTWPELASIQVEHADGSTYSAAVEDDGCVVVFAPVTSEPSPTDDVIVRHFDANGQLITEERGWLGAGGRPPPEVLKAWQGDDAG